MEERYLVKPFSCWGQGLIDSPGQCAVPPLHLASPPSWLGQGCYITDTREPDYPSKCIQHCKNIELSMYTYNSKFIWITFAINWHKKNHPKFKWNWQNIHVQRPKLLSWIMICPTKYHLELLCWFIFIFDISSLKYQFT